MKEVEGYRKLRATDLSTEQQNRLRRALQHDLAEEMVRAARENPPEIDLAQIDVILPAGADHEWAMVADCGTCGTCVTCVTCVTS